MAPLPRWAPGALVLLASMTSLLSTLPSRTLKLKARIGGKRWLNMLPFCKHKDMCFTLRGGKPRNITLETVKRPAEESSRENKRVKSGTSEEVVKKNFSWMPSSSTIFTSATSNTSASASVIQSLFGTKQANKTQENPVAGEEGKDDDEEQVLDQGVVNATSGEENETHIWQGTGNLFVLMEDKNWHVRGVGQARVNQGIGYARIIMRAEKTNKLLLNTPIQPSTDVKKHSDGTGAIFRGPNYVGNTTNTTYSVFALAFKEKDVLKSFIESIDETKKSLFPSDEGVGANETST